ncbi:hypothetical protein HK098_003201 [Nowakowskiella sp. JEL0407]|nr:hypothetical protein HK098_003201 [Nowakowskiella sp. JEL0407]
MLNLKPHTTAARVDILYEDILSLIIKHISLNELATWSRCDKATRSLLSPFLLKNLANSPHVQPLFNAAKERLHITPNSPTDIDNFHQLLLLASNLLNCNDYTVFFGNIPILRSYASVYAEVLLEEEGMDDSEPADVDEYTINSITYCRLEFERKKRDAHVRRQYLRTKAVLSWIWCVYLPINDSVACDRITLSVTERQIIKDLHRSRGYVTDQMILHALSVSDLGIKESGFLDEVYEGSLVTITIDVLHRFKAYVKQSLENYYNWVEIIEPIRFVLGLPSGLEVQERKKIHLLCEQSLEYHASFEITDGKVHKGLKDGDRRLYVSSLPFPKDIESSSESDLAKSQGDEVVFGGYKYDC